MNTSHPKRIRWPQERTSTAYIQIKGNPLVLQALSVLLPQVEALLSPYNIEVLGITTNDIEQVIDESSDINTDSNNHLSINEDVSNSPITKQFESLHSRGIEVNSSHSLFDDEELAALNRVMEGIGNVDNYACLKETSEATQQEEAQQVALQSTLNVNEECRDILKKGDLIPKGFDRLKKGDLVMEDKALLSRLASVSTYSEEDRSIKDNKVEQVNYRLLKVDELVEVNGIKALVPRVYKLIEIRMSKAMTMGQVESFVNYVSKSIGKDTQSLPVSLGKKVMHARSLVREEGEEITEEASNKYFIIKVPMNNMTDISSNPSPSNQVSRPIPRYSLT